MRCITSILAPVSSLAAISRAGQALPLLATLFFAQSTLHAQIAPPAAINFQGRLAMPSGNPVPNGNYNLIFNFYAAPTGNNRIGQKIINNVPVKNGTFAALFDSLPATLFNGNVWLGIVIGNDAELAPRTQIVSVPYALKSTLALTVPDGSITNAKLAGGITADKFADGTFNGLAWLLGGNSGTNGTQFLGTTDNQPFLFKTNNAERMRILGNGNVGIGTATPVAPLSFASTTGEKITLFGQSATTYGFGVQGGLLQIHGDVPVSDIAFGYGSSTAFTETMRVKGNGNVGIGTNSPLRPLHIAASANPEIRLQDTGTGGKTFHIGINSADGALHFAQSGIRDIMTLQSVTGNVGIGTDSPKAALHVNGDYYGKGHLWLHANEGDGSSGTAYIQARDDSTTSNLNMVLRTKTGINLKDNVVLYPDGRMAVNGIPHSNATFSVSGSGLAYSIGTNGDIGATRFVVLSDARLKEHIETVPDALSTLLGLRGVSYDWKPSSFVSKGGGKERQYGFLAQEVETVLPALVQPGLNGYKAVNYLGVIPVTVEAIKTLNARSIGQQSHIEMLRKENEGIRRENDALRASLDVILRRLDAMDREGVGGRR